MAKSDKQTSQYFLVGPSGIEPEAFYLASRRSNLLSYGPPEWEKINIQSSFQTKGKNSQNK